METEKIYFGMAVLAAVLIIIGTVIAIVNNKREKKFPESAYGDPRKLCSFFLDEGCELVDSVYCDMPVCLMRKSHEKNKKLKPKRK